MKKEFLKIAGVKSEKEFYKKYPSEEAFFKAHPKALSQLKKSAEGGEAYPQTATMTKFFSYGAPVPPTYYSHGGAYPMAQPENLFFSPFYGNVPNPYNKAMGGSSEAYPQSMSFPYGATGRSTHFMMQEGGNAQADQIMKQVANALQQGAKPEEAVKFLVSKGVPQENAVQIVKGIMQQISGAQQQAAQQQQAPPQEMQQMQEAPPMEQPQMDFGGSSNTDMGVKNKTGYFTGLVQATAGNAANKEILKNAASSIKRKGGALLKAQIGTSVEPAAGGYSDPGVYASKNPISAANYANMTYDPTKSGDLTNFLDSVYKSYYDLDPSTDITNLRTDPIYNQLAAAYNLKVPTSTSNNTATQNQNQNQNQNVNVQNPGIQAFVPGLYDPRNTNQFIVTSNNMPVKYKAFDRQGNKIDYGRMNQPLIYGMYPELHGMTGIDPTQGPYGSRAKGLGLVKYDENLPGQGWFARNFMRAKRTYYFEDTPTSLPGGANNTTTATTNTPPPLLAAPPTTTVPNWNTFTNPTALNQFLNPGYSTAPNVTVPYLPGYTPPTAPAPGSTTTPGATSNVPASLNPNSPPYQAPPFTLPTIPGTTSPNVNVNVPYAPAETMRSRSIAPLVQQFTAPNISGMSPIRTVDPASIIQSLPTREVPNVPSRLVSPVIPGITPGPFSSQLLNQIQQQLVVPTVQTPNDQGPLLLPGMISYDDLQAPLDNADPSILNTDVSSLPPAEIYNYPEFKVAEEYENDEAVDPSGYVVYDPENPNKILAKDPDYDRAIAAAQKEYDKKYRKSKKYGGIPMAKTGLDFNNKYNKYNINQYRTSSFQPKSNNLTTDYDTMIRETEMSPAGKLIRNTWSGMKENAYPLLVGATAGLADLFSNSTNMQQRLGANDYRNKFFENYESIQGANPTTPGSYIVNTNNNFEGPQFNRSDIRYDVAPMDYNYSARMGGAIKEGEIVDMTPQEIAEFVRNGGQIEYVS